MYLYIYIYICEWSYISANTATQDANESSI